MTFAPPAVTLFFFVVGHGDGHTRVGFCSPRLFFRLLGAVVWIGSGCLPRSRCPAGAVLVSPVLCVLVL